LTLMLWLALGYFLAYIPYAALAKAISSGYVPGVEAQGGLVLLPATALGQLIVMPLFLLGSGWWRYGSRRMVMGRRIFLPQKPTVLAGLLTAVIIGSTTLNFTFPGVSILFMLLMMRAGTLALSPAADGASGRKVHWHSWAAVGFSLLGVALALGDVDDYSLTLGAVLSLAAYLAAYAGRFQIMGRIAKTGVREADRRYLVGEHASAPVFLTLLLGIGALAGQPDLRAGFTSFLRSPAAVPAMAIGVFYECLFVFGTLIYLHRNEYSWAVPINRGSSLISGVAASFVLVALTPMTARDLPGTGQQLALGAVLCAAVMVCVPAIRRAMGRGDPLGPPRLILFVCGANTCRSPMAEAIAREEVAIARAGHRLAVSSAGVAVRTVGAPMTPEAIVALGEMGIEVHHRTRALTAETCRSADVIYCMTASQRRAVLAMAPEVADRTFCLDPEGDIPDPAGQPPAVYRELAGRLRSLVRARLAEQSLLSFPAAPGR
jgi:protein-tyrosine-phosphatase